MVCSLALSPVYAAQPINGLHITDAYYGDISQRVLVVEAVFYNVSNTIISNFKNVELTMNDAHNNPIAAATFNDPGLASLKLGPGETAKWYFNISNPAKGMDLSNYSWDTSFEYAYQAGNETEKGIKVYYNGEKINFSGTKPVIKNGYTLVPVRGVFEKMGAEVKWDNKSQTVTITEGDNTIKLTLNSKKASVNGSTVNLDVPVQSINNRTLIPLRFITEAIGGSIFWGGTEADGYIAICK